MKNRNQKTMSKEKLADKVLKVVKLTAVLQEARQSVHVIKN